ncbi:SPOR domain-containing protein [Klebsiella pneumoniae subsp. pneumoniae]|nr:SPOR domain-containing protein [Klebsiella pneumoniae subsp. pneumoniae]
MNEIVGKLRASGFKVYTSPSTPVQGKITRILVGPDASKDKLKGQLGDLQQISGLSGVVMGFTPELIVFPPCGERTWRGETPRKPCLQPP